MSGYLVVASSAEPYGVYIGRGACPRSGEVSRWSVPGSIALGDPTAAGEAYRRWLWSELSWGRVGVGDLIALNRKVFGVRLLEEAVHAPVLRSAALWAMAEQARRLERRFDERRRSLRAGR